MTRTWPARDPLVTRSWPARDPLVTRSWPAHDPLVTRSWPARDPVLTRSWPGPDPVLTRSWPSPDPLLTCFWPAPDLLLNCSWPAPDLLLTRSWPAPDLLLTCSWPAPDLLLTCSPCRRLPVGWGPARRVAPGAPVGVSLFLTYPPVKARRKTCHLQALPHTILTDPVLTTHYRFYKTNNQISPKGKITWSGFLLQLLLWKPLSRCYFSNGLHICWEAGKWFLAWLSSQGMWQLVFFYMWSILDLFPLTVYDQEVNCVRNAECVTISYNPMTSQRHGVYSRLKKKNWQYVLAWNFSSLSVVFILLAVT